MERSLLAEIFINKWSYDPEIDDQVTDEAGRLNESWAMWVQAAIVYS
jgi:hypothetical protein